MQSEIDYYSVLRLKPGSSMDDIRRQYRRLAKVYHPDRNPGEEEWCAEQLTQVNKAYEYLSNPERKAAYDATFRAKPTSTGSRPAPGAREQPRPEARHNPHNNRRTEFPSAAAYSSIKRADANAPTEKPAPTGRQIATMLLGGTGVGVLGAGISMALFAYLHPPQSRNTVLPVIMMNDGNAQSQSKDAETHVVRHHIHYRQIEADEPEKRRSTNGESRQSEVARLNHLGVQVPAVGFSDQELHDMAARLQAYDRSH